MRVLLHSKSHIVDDIPGFEREPDTDRADADLTAEEAGRLCYLSGHRPNPKTATNPDYLLNIENEHHYSVIGHPAVTFYIDGISRNCTHEIIRHRWFTFSEVSQRYVDASNFEMVEHPGLDKLPLGSKVNDLLDAAWTASMGAYDATVSELVNGFGLPRKQARQAARSILPGGIETKIMMSGNLRSWRDFLAQRLSKHADLEIRAVALEIFRVLRAEFPSSFQDFDPQGMITVERLIQRALDRHDREEMNTHLTQARTSRKCVEEVRKILANGLWTLKSDPWEDEAV